MSVIVENDKNQHILICKGASKRSCNSRRMSKFKDEILEVTAEHDEHRKQRVKQLEFRGLRVIAVAYRVFPGTDDTPHTPTG